MGRLHLNTNFDKLPKHQSMRKGNKDWGGRRSYYKYKRRWCWDVVVCMMHKYEGKCVNAAFSEYCTLMPPYLQQEFWDYFDKNARRLKYCTSYGIDDNNCIVIYPKITNPEVIFYSIDYKVEKNPLFSKQEYDNVFNKKPSWVAEPVLDKYILTSGFSQVFSSRRDPAYQRLQQEKLQTLKKFKKIRANEKQEKSYQFLTREEIAKKENKQDRIDKQRLGFDENSFRGLEYHGKKRKRK